MTKKHTWWLLLALLVTCALVVAFHFSDRALLGELQKTMARLRDDVTSAPLPVILIYFAIYVATAAISLPFSGLLTLAAGALFGFWWGLLLAMVSASAGSLAGFIVSRYLFHAAVERRFGERLAPIHKGLHDEGAFYLFSIRMVPVFPYWLVNLLMGLTSMRAFTFWWVGTLGLLPIEAAYVFAGTRLATITKASDVISPDLIAALLGLALMILLLRRAVRWVELRYFTHEAE